MLSCSVGMPPVAFADNLNRRIRLLISVPEACLRPRFCLENPRFWSNQRGDPKDTSGGRFPHGTTRLNGWGLQGKSAREVVWARPVWGLIWGLRSRSCKDGRGGSVLDGTKSGTPGSHGPRFMGLGLRHLDEWPLGRMATWTNGKAPQDETIADNAKPCWYETRGSNAFAIRGGLEAG